MISSLQTRLMLAVGVLALAAVGAVALSARQSTRIEFRKFQELEQRRSADVPETRPGQIAAILAGRCCTPQSLSAAATLLDAGQAVLVIDQQGRLIASAGPGAAGLTTVTTRVAEGVLRVDAVSTRHGVAQGITLQFRGQPAARIATADGSAADVYVIPLPDADLGAPAAVFLGSLDRRLLAATTVIGLLSLGVTWTIARRIIQPIGELGRAARDLATGDLSRRVDTSGADEIGALGRSFNTMAAELERQQMLRRSLVHDVAHELRTPLTALRCRLETMIDGLAVDEGQTLAGANNEVRHLSRLVDDLQELAVAEAHELRLSTGDVPIAEVTRSAVGAAGLENDPRLRLAIDAALIGRADPLRLRQVLMNLLTNADRHTPPGGSITVRGTRQGTVIVVDVSNSGSALDDTQLARVFDRFYRVDPARQRATGGTGLGLAIVKHLVEAQGGRVSASSDDGGVTISFTLPAAGSSDHVD